MNDLAEGSLVESLSSQGVHYVFGLPGTQNVALFEALRRSPIRTVLATSELNAAFMAVGYARASGRPGILTTIPGPGLTYALPGLAEARLDSVPLIHILVSPEREPGRRFQHQEIDNLGLISRIAKDIVRAPSAGDVPAALARAWDLATSGEPGPVVLWLGGGDQAPASEAGEVEDGEVNPDGSGEPPDGLADLAHRVEKARRPVLFLGLGAVDSAPRIRELAEALRAPVFTTPSARGTLPEDHPYALAFDFESGGLEALNDLLDTSDLILALGCKLSHNGTGGFRLRLERGKLVHVNTDRVALGANYEASAALPSSVESVVTSVLGALKTNGPESVWTQDMVGQWRGRIASGPQGSPAEPEVSGVPSGSMREFIDIFRGELPRDAVVVTDSGLHQALFRRHFPVLSPRGLILPTDFQSMGFGLPAAIGASLAAPERKVVAVIGDGGFAMSGMELLTLVREDLPVSVIVFNDGQLNLIRLQQERDFGSSHAVRLQNPDFQVFAEAVGVEYVRLDDSVKERMGTGLRSQRPTLFDLPLGDSGAIRSVRRKAQVKSGARTLLGEGGVRRLNRLRRLLGL